MSDFENAKDELLETLEPREEKTEKSTKRGSKDDLISKIHKICDENNIICEYSTTQLKRSTKKRLAEILAELIERAMEQKIRDQIRVKSVEGATQDQNDQLVAIGALRLLHDSLARATEIGMERFTPYQLEGFTSSMQAEPVSEQIDSCLAEIAEEYKDVVELISSPYTKLALIWSTSAAATAKRKPQSYKYKKNAINSRHLGSGTSGSKKTLDRSISGWETSREELHANTPPKTV